MQSILKSLAEEKTAAQLQFLSRASMNWLTDRINELRNTRVIPRQISRDNNRFVTRFLLGGLYFFYYDPKTKADLPYYDRFPLVLMLQRYPDGFLGLNLHYLPIKQRAALLKKLVDYGGVYTDNNEIHRVRITYDILNTARRFKEFRPCLKKYLYTNLDSRILAVQPNEWEVATYPPIQQFRGAQPKQVWQDSLQEIRKS